jgi:hypothetical protein
MGGENQDGEQASEEVTVVVNRKIKSSCEKDYDEWLRRFLVLERKVHGYLGTTTIMETSTDSTVRHIIHRFRDKAHRFVDIAGWLHIVGYIKNNGTSSVTIEPTITGRVMNAELQSILCVLSILAHRFHYYTYCQVF